MIEALMWLIAIFAVIAQLWIEIKNKTDEIEREKLYAEIRRKRDEDETKRKETLRKVL